MDAMLTWLLRWLHVLGAAVWVGGYVILAFVVVPTLTRESHEAIRQLALVTVRLLSFAGTLTILAGALLVTRSRGYDALFRGEWGGIVISAIVLAVALMALGDSGLRPALRRLRPGDPASVVVARRWALAGLTLTVLALMLMTRAPYATS
jgi:putative copper export protein